MAAYNGHLGCLEALVQHLGQLPASILYAALNRVGGGRAGRRADGRQHTVCGNKSYHWFGHSRSKASQSSGPFAARIGSKRSLSACAASGLPPSAHPTRPLSFTHSCLSHSCLSHSCPPGPCSPPPAPCLPPSPGGSSQQTRMPGCRCLQAWSRRCRPLMCSPSSPPTRPSWRVGATWVPRGLRMLGPDSCYEGRQAL